MKWLALPLEALSYLQTLIHVIASACRAVPLPVGPQTPLHPSGWNVRQSGSVAERGLWAWGPSLAIAWLAGLSGLLNFSYPLFLTSSNRPG